MRIVRELKDGSGKRFEVVVTVREQGEVLERAILSLAAKARGSKKSSTTDAFGIIDVVVRPVLEVAP